jgi:DNA-binding NarL/FixJ family response regulator
MMANGPTVSLLICDDHKVLTDALSMVVGLDQSLSLVAAPVHSPEEGVALAAEQLPDVVLMDIVFKGSAMTGIEATRRIKEGSPSTKVVIMTAHDDDRLMVEAVEAGASGFLSKDLPVDEILSATKAAAEGEVLIDPATLTRCWPSRPRARATARRDGALGDLTSRAGDPAAAGLGSATTTSPLVLITRKPSRRTSGTSSGSSASTPSSRPSRSRSNTV